MQAARDPADFGGNLSNPCNDTASGITNAVAVRLVCFIAFKDGLVKVDGSDTSKRR